MSDVIKQQITEAINAWNDLPYVEKQNSTHPKHMAILALAEKGRDLGVGLDLSVQEHNHLDGTKDATLHYYFTAL